MPDQMRLTPGTPVPGRYLCGAATRAERDREREADRAVAAERAGIARELHDVIAHHMRVMVIQAGAAGCGPTWS